jgi:hypothetical protein
LDITAKLAELRKTKTSVDNQLSQAKTDFAVAEAEVVRIQEEIKQNFNCSTVEELEAKLVAIAGEIQASDKLLGEALQFLSKKDYSGVIKLLGGTK